MSLSETLEASLEIGSIRVGSWVVLSQKAGFPTKQPENHYGIGLRVLKYYFTGNKKKQVSHIG
jgi:hypothetical protein